MVILIPCERKEKPTGSAASCGMVKLETSISPMVKPVPAANSSSLGVYSGAHCVSEPKMAGAVRRDI